LAHEEHHQLDQRRRQPAVGIAAARQGERAAGLPGGVGGPAGRRPGTFLQVARRIDKDDRTEEYPDREGVMTTSEAAGAQPPAYKRKMRNYLLDVGLQLRYTATIVVVAIFLTAGLGFKMYQATREISRIILFTGLADPATAQELQTQFANSDRIVLWGIIGFGIVL